MQVTPQSQPSGSATLLVTVKGNHSVTFLDEATGRILAAPVVGAPAAQPHEIILSADGRRAFVSLYGDNGYPDNVPNNQIAVLDVASMTLDRVIGLDLYRGPHGMARDHLGRIWVTAECNQCILAIDTDTCEIRRTVFSETRCHFLCPSRDGRLIYSSHKEIPYIGVFDVETCRMVDKIALEIGSQALSHAPDADRLYVGDFFRPMVHVVDAASRQVVQTVPLRGIPGWPYATPDGRHLVVSTFIETEGRGFIEVFDTDTLTPRALVELPAEPYHLLDGDDGRSVLAVVGDGRLLRIDLESGEIDPCEYPVGAGHPEQVVRSTLPRPGR